MNIRRLFLALLLSPILSSATPALRVLPWDQAIAARKFALVSGDSVVEIKDLHPSKRTAFIRVKGSGPVMVQDRDVMPDVRAARRLHPLLETYHPER